MSKLNGTLHIVLKSDLCSGSGDGFSSGIDIDVCYDAKGLPTIPGRRIKGCLLEAAKLMCCDPDGIDAVFGVSGQELGGSLRVDDAVLPEADRVVVAGDAQATLDRYTIIRAKTALDETTGSAKDNTLRFERVVRHWLPNDEGGFKEAEFVASISVDESGKELMETAARAFRNTGLGRNRGYGAVRCKVEWSDATDATPVAANVVRFERDGKAMAAISYQVNLDSPVMLPRDNSTRSAACIPGTSVLGCFAGRLRDSARFDEIFLSGAVKFSPLYPVDTTGARTLPAPSFIVKAKGGDLDGSCLLATGVPEGQTVKPLKDGFVGSDWLPVGVSTETTYHHSRVGDGMLYTQRALSAGQAFAGFIECPEELADELLGVLAQGELSFGRSKTAQYARCSVLPCKSDFSLRDATVDIAAGDTVVAVLESDLLLVDDAKSATSFEALVSGLQGILGPWATGVDFMVADEAPIVTNVRHRTASGYNARRNQKRAHVRTFTAGSSVAFVVPEDAQAASIPAVYLLGERQAEGFGRVRLVNLTSVKVGTKAADVDNDAPATSEAEAARQNMLCLADGMRNREFKQLTPSFIGRLNLMVRESQSKRGLEKRIESIKDSDKRKAANNLVNKVEQGLPKDVSWPLEQECLDLVLDLAKYFSKQTKGNASEGRDA